MKPAIQFGGGAAAELIPPLERSGSGFREEILRCKTDLQARISHLMDGLEFERLPDLPGLGRVEDVHDSFSSLNSGASRFANSPLLRFTGVAFAGLGRFFPVPTRRN